MISRILELLGVAPPKLAGGSTVDAQRHFQREDVWVEAEGSSNVARFAYWPADGGILAVRFLAKGSRPEVEYRYFGVPAGVFTSMAAAASRGRFVWTDLRDRYDYEGPLGQPGSRLVRVKKKTK